MTPPDRHAMIGRPRRKRRELFTAPTIGTRKEYAPGETIPLADLRLALVEAAKLVEIDQRALVLFQRIEAEIRNREEQESAMARARQLLQSQDVTP